MNNSKTITKKKVTSTSGYRIMIRSRHPSHSPLRRVLPRMAKPAVVRLGSTTEMGTGTYIQVNTVEAIKNSASKLRMKNCFQKADVKTAKWATSNSLKDLLVKAKELTGGWKTQLVCKSFFGSRGVGNFLISSKAALTRWAEGKTLSGYIYERFYDYSREYRLHVTEDGCFYTCRKMLKSDVPDDKRWYRNDSNCTWILETNPMFSKPSNWKEVTDECVKALKAVGLDVGACDVKMASKDPTQFIILEINSAPSLGEITLVKYTEQIPLIIAKKMKK